MSRKAFGVILLLIGSIVLGLLAGEAFHRLHLQRIPGSAADFPTPHVDRDTHFWFLLYGFLLGLGAFLWALVSIGASRGFQARRRPPELPGIDSTSVGDRL